MTDDLTLPQAFILLCLNDHTGKAEGTFFQPAVAGAALAELLLLGAIELSNDEPSRVIPLRHYKTLSTFLRLCDEEIGRAPKPLSLEQWVAKLTNIDGLITTVADELCHMGVLSKERSSVLGVFSRTVWPTVSPIMETDLKANMAKIMFEGGDADARDIALIALAKAAGILHFNFDLDKISAHGDRIDALTQVKPEPTRPVMQVVKTSIAAIVAASVSGEALPGTIIS